MPVVAMAAVVREEPGVVAGALEVVVDDVLAIAGAMVVLWLLQDGVALWLC